MNYLKAIILMSLAYGYCSDVNYDENIPSELAIENYKAELQDLGEHIEVQHVPPKIVTITKTVAVKVPIPYPVKIKQHVPYPVHVSKPYAVPVPQIVQIPVVVEKPKPVKEQITYDVPISDSYNENRESEQSEGHNTKIKDVAGLLHYHSAPQQEWAPQIQEESGDVNYNGHSGNNYEQAGLNNYDDQNNEQIVHEVEDRNSANNEEESAESKTYEDAIKNYFANNLNIKRGFVSKSK